ncbi:MAG: TIM44-like domain-containing protein, partial [Actinomycetota bacterium]|nr:TIM44-like domain-containing protein [Actinomycetota bacterium]
MASSAGDEMSIRSLRTLAPAVTDGDGPDWQPSALASRVVRCFDAVQLAWTRRDQQGLAPYVSDAMHARIDTWFDGFEDLSQVNRIENLELEHTTLTRIEFGDSAEEDRLVAEVGFSAHDWLEDVRTGAILEGQADAATHFEQRWTFVHEAERGWVVDSVEQHSPHGPPSPPAARAPESRQRREAPPSRTPVIGPPLPPPVPRTSSPREERWVPGHPGAAPMERPPARSATGGAPRVLLLLLLCVVLVAGAARAGLSLGTSSVANRADAERARAQGRQAIAGPAFRRAFDQAQARGRQAGLVRGRKAGRTRGARQGRRAGRAEA